MLTLPGIVTLHCQCMRGCLVQTASNPRQECRMHISVPFQSRGADLAFASHAVTCKTVTLLTVPTHLVSSVARTKP